MWRPAFLNPYANASNVDSGYIMSLEQVFVLAGNIAMTGWVVLAFGPRSWPWLNAIPRIVVPLVLSIINAAYIFPFFAASGGGYGTLAEVRQLFTLDELLLAGWVHYLAFDLMIGAYLADRLDRLQVSRLAQLPILFCTLMFGPVGVILSFAVEAALRAPARWTREAV